MDYGEWTRTKDPKKEIINRIQTGPKIYHQAKKDPKMKFRTNKTIKLRPNEIKIETHMDQKE